MMDLSTSAAARLLKRATATILGERLYGSVRRAVRGAPGEYVPKITTVDLGNRHAQFYSATLLAEKRANDILIKEPGTIAWLDRLQSDDVLWDVGANIGVYSIYAAMMHHSRVIAFEPVAANYYLLNRNIELNRIDSLVTAYCLALADREGYEPLFIPKTTPAASAASYGRQATVKLRHRQGCIGATIDGLAGIMPFPTHIKIDVDGLEPQIIAGAGRTLRDERLRSISVELTRDNCASMIESLAALGLVVEGGDPSIPEEGRVKNFIFIRSAG